MTEMHPIIVQMQPSPEQQPAILARGTDVTVTAGAGTGKTLSLVARYLSLVAGDETGAPDLRSVVAVTFTRKAAREMRNRVRVEVSRYLETHDLEDAELARWRDLYAELDAARIGTIHSLCGEILRHHPAEAGIDPGFEMLNEGQMALLRAQVADEALGWVAGSPDLVALFVLLGEAGVRSLVITLLDHRLDLAAAWAQPPGAAKESDSAESLLARWDRMLTEHRNRALTRFLQDPGFADALATLRVHEPGDPADKIAQQWARVVPALSAAPDVDAEALSVLGTINLTGGRRGAWGGKEELARVKAALKALRELWQEGAPALTLTLNELDSTLAAHMPLIRRLFAWCDRRYAELKADRRALDFDDLEAGALILLQEHPGVAASWRRDVTALLLDEAQDANRRQLQLLELMNGGGGKLFTVGDAKQSIYRFRGAEVTAFRGQTAQARGGGSIHRTLNLATSYRAHCHLLALLNALLAPVLGSREDPERPYVEPFAPLMPSREEPVAGVQPPFVELHLALGTKQDGALDRAASVLVQRLVDLVEGGRATVPEGAASLSYGDIAILCRAASSFAPYEDALEAAGVPFLTVAGRGFYERPEVRDVLNALQALSDPTDDLALAGLLRSPAMGLSDMALYRLAAARRQIDGAGLWDVLSGEVGFLEEEVTAAIRARTIVTRLHTLAGRVPVADVLKGFLDETGYRAALRRARQGRAIHNLDKLLADAHQSDMVDMDAFLEYVQQLRDVGTREGEAHVLAEGAVQLMTAHAAKGLEFPVVVIGDISRGSPGRYGPLIDSAPSGQSAGLVLPLKERLHPDDEKEAVPAIYRLVQAREQDQEQAESDRLLYVAATRARDLLLISGMLGSRSGDWLDRLRLSLDIPVPSDFKGDENPQATATRLDLAGHAVGLTVYPPHFDAGIDVPRTGSVPTVSAPAWVAPEEMPMLRHLVPDVARSDEAAEEALRDPPQRVWRVVPPAGGARAPSWVVGQLVHGALERWLFPDGPGGGFWTWAGAEASGCGITDMREAQDAAHRAAAMLRRFQATSLYDQMEAAVRIYRELPYSLMTNGGTVESGVIDALFESAEGWSLVEFKSDYVRSDAHLEVLLAGGDYIAQVGAYLDAVERLVGRRPAPVLCFLNCGGAVRLVTDRW